MRIKHDKTHQYIDEYFESVSYHDSIRESYVKFHFILVP